MKNPSTSHKTPVCQTRFSQIYFRLSTSLLRIQFDKVKREVSTPDQQVRSEKRVLRGMSRKAGFESERRVLADVLLFVGSWKAQVSYSRLSCSNFSFLQPSRCFMICFTTKCLRCHFIKQKTFLNLALSLSPEPVATCAFQGSRRCSSKLASLALKATKCN